MWLNILLVGLRRVDSSSPEVTAQKGSVSERVWQHLRPSRDIQNRTNIFRRLSLSLSSCHWKVDCQFLVLLSRSRQFNTQNFYAAHSLGRGVTVARNMDTDPDVERYSYICVATWFVRATSNQWVTAVPIKSTRSWLADSIIGSNSLPIQYYRFASKISSAKIFFFSFFHFFDRSSALFGELYEFASTLVSSVYAIVKFIWPRF